ncbi:porin [Aliidiomarina celeris]|uniref:porin n=1 Tax=Aliidiomarina celeris TaxID=2249428 RepID=UPI000DEB43A9|nr:porin [Aliidiomarina celeris]
MNRTLPRFLVLSSLGVFATSVSANTVFDTIDLDFSGQLRVSTDYLYDGNDGGLNASSNASRLGLNVSHAINENLTVIGKVEKQIDLSEGSGSFGSRDTFLGLRGNFGTLRVGYMTSPTMAMLSAVEEFRDRVGDGRNMLRRGAMNLDRRYRNAVHYQTPNLNGLVWAVHYGTNEAGGATVDNEQDMLGTSLTYKTGEWTFAAGYQQDNRNLGETIKGTRFSAIRQGDGWRVAGIVQRVDGLAEGDMNGWLLTGRYQYSEKVWLRAQVGARSYDQQDNESQLITVGFDRNFTSQFTWYGMFTMTQNDDAAVASVTEGGYGKNLVVVPGEDPFAVSSGFIFKF